MMKPSTRSIAILLCLGVARVADQSSLAAEPVWYGGIEIGAKGVKVVAIPISGSGRPELSRMIKELPRQAINNLTLAERAPDGSFQQAAIDEVRAAVKDYHEDLTGNKNIPPERIWVVASSGLTAKGRPKNFDALRKAVVEATGGEETLVEIDQKREVELLMLGAIPKEHLRDTILVDIGSGSSKLGYIEPKVGFNPGRSVVGSAQIEGVVGFRQSIMAEMNRSGKKGFTSFREVATDLRPGIDAKILGEVGRKPGLMNRPRVVLLGGVAWAIGMLTDPERMLEDDLLFKFQLDQLAAFHKTIRETGVVPKPEVANLPEAIQEQAINETSRARDLFPPEDFLAGSEILLSFAESLQWQEQKKDVFFVKSGVVAWIVAFVEEARTK